MSDEMLFFPKARIAQGNGDLLQATNVKLDIKNAAKLQHTLRRTPAGYTLGPREAELSFDAVVDEDGFERDWLKLVLEGTAVQFRIKTPGETLTFTGVCTSRAIDNSIEDAIKYTVSAIGKVSAS